MDTLNDYEMAAAERSLAAAKAIGILIGLRKLEMLPALSAKLADDTIAEYERANAKCAAICAGIEAQRAIEAAQAQVRG
jgi:hypothetical protein